MNFIKMVTLLAFSVMMTACAVPFPNQNGGFAGTVHGRDGSLSFGGNGSTGVGASQVVAQGARVPVCNNGKLPGILHLPSDAKNGQIVCAFPGDRNVQFLQQQVQIQQRYIVGNSNSLSANNCPSGYRMNSVGSWMCRD
jgi:hypothetical protein